MPSFLTTTTDFQVVTTPVGPPGPKGDTGSSGPSGSYDGGANPASLNPNANLPKRGTAAEWTSANPVLGASELGVETDTKHRKRGDGTTAWNSLPYVYDSYSATAPPLAATVTKRLYARTQPLLGGTQTFRVIAKDPNQNGVHATGRIWGIGSSFAQLGYSDDDGATWQAKCGPFETGLSVQQMRWSNNFLWVVIASVASASGSVWRFAVPGANGNPGSIGTDAAANQWAATITAGSNGASLPQATINISNGNYFASSGKATVFTASGPQVVSYTGKTAGTLTGCTGGTGAMATGGLVLVGHRVEALGGAALGPAGGSVSGSLNSTYRTACFDIAPDESIAILGEYGAANSSNTHAGFSDAQLSKFGNTLASASGTASVSQIGSTVTISDGGGADIVLSIRSVIRESAPAIWGLNQIAQREVSAGTAVWTAATVGAGVIPGGPKVYHSTNAGAADPTTVLWAVGRTFPQAKHCHAVKVRNGYLWANFGDMGTGFTYCGIWNATVGAPTAWTARTSNTEGGIPKDPINMLPITIDGAEVWICESDNGWFDGPLCHDDTTGPKTKVLRPLCRIPAPHKQTMRSLANDPTTGNIYWVGTGEAGAVGPTTCIWMARAPYGVPVLLENVGSALDAETLGEGVISNGYYWPGTFRVVVEKLIGQ